MIKKIKTASDYAKQLLEERKTQELAFGENTEFIDFHKSIENMMTDSSSKSRETVNKEPNIFNLDVSRQL